MTRRDGPHEVRVELDGVTNNLRIREGPPVAATAGGESPSPELTDRLIEALRRKYRDATSAGGELDPSLRELGEALGW